MFRASHFTMYHQRGFILVELMLALGMLAIIGGFISMTFYAGERSGTSSLRRIQGVQLAQEAIDAAKSVAEEDYYTFYSLSKGSGNPYHPVISSGKWTLATGTEDITLDGKTLTRKVVIDNVSRDDTSGNIVTSGGTDDPSTQKITATVSLTGQSDVVLIDFYTRWRNTVPAQTSWAGGSGAAGPITSFSTGYDTDDTNIDATSTPGSIQLKLQ